MGNSGESLPKMARDLQPLRQRPGKIIGELQPHPKIDISKGCKELIVRAIHREPSGRLRDDIFLIPAGGSNPSGLQLAWNRH
jgi:hypothetical protein